MTQVSSMGIGSQDTKIYVSEVEQFSTSPRYNPGPHIKVRKGSRQVTANKGVLDRSHSAKSVFAMDNSYIFMISVIVSHVPGRNIGLSGNSVHFYPIISLKNFQGQ